jgi:hypothetical protein
MCGVRGKTNTRPIVSLFQALALFYLSSPVYLSHESSNNQLRNHELTA